jgi:type VI secretion system secreted protein VgrG
MVRVDSGDALDVRSFSVEERMSALFEITVVALSADADVDFDAIVGRPARLDVHTGAGARVPVRSWTGVCRDIQLVAAEETGLSTYHLHLVPTLWLATQRRNHRMFQQMSELEIARALLAEWGITPDLRITGRYKKREYRVQYAESDFAFLSRMLEDAGISFFFEQGEAETRLVLSDAPHLDAPRPPIAFRDRPTAADREHVTRVSLAQRIRPGRYTIKDHDPRLPPSYDLRAGAAVAAGSVEGRLERFHYVPGAFQFGADQGESAPFGDDRGKTRTDEKEAGSLAQKRLDAKRARAKVCSFETNAADLAPGVVLSVLDHPRADLAADKRLLVIQSSLRGTAAGDWHHRCEALSAEIAYRPSLATPKPRALGVESATVVGPAGDEIHTDELGRVRVHFHWDRESRMNEQSSCWIHVSQPWAGRGFGVISLPRVGQEVLVDFLGGDPDRPVITGRVYTSPQRVPYALPANKTQSGWKSESSPGGGGFNEIRFEDAKGREQVYLQAEKDLDELVKHDETVTIGNDRRELVKHDEALTVDHDRRRKVGNDESIAVDHDRVKVVGHDESVTVGHDRTRVVAHDESISIGNDRTKQVKRNERETVGKSRTRVVGVNESVKIGKSQRVKVGGQKSEKVGKSSTETVGLAKTVTVGGMHTTTVGGAMTTTVGLMSTETVGLVKHVKAGDKIEITCGKSKIVMERSGKITLSGTEIVIKGKDAVKVDGKEIAVKADDNASVQGGKVQVVGDPIDLN